MSGKGDTPRPKAVSEAEYADNYARTFGRYAAEQALAKRIAHDLRAVLAKLPDQPPCHDYPPDFTLPTTDPESTE